MTRLKYLLPLWLAPLCVLPAGRVEAAPRRRSRPTSPARLNCRPTTWSC